MDQFLIDNAVWVSVGMMVVSIGFIALIVRWSGGRLPSDGMARAVLAMCALILVLGGFLLLNSQAGGPHKAVAEGTVPDFDFTIVDGDVPAALEEYRGNVVLLNFWATWCAPCIDEMPDLNELHQAYADEGLRVVTISDEVPEMIREFEERGYIELETVSGYVDGDELPMPFRRMQEARPLTFLIDRDGVLRATLLGIRTYDQLEALVTPLLEEEPLASS